MKRKILFGGLALLCLLIAICVYFAHPKYVFTLTSGAGRGNYMFSFYGSRTMVVTYGFKKPYKIERLRRITIKKTEEYEYRYKASFKQNIVVKIGIKQLSKKQYNEFVELFSEAEKNRPKYVNDRELLKGGDTMYSNNSVTGPMWEAVFKTQTGIANIYFS